MIFLFDVDGTLTPTREKIDPEFKKFLMSFKHDIRIISGSDVDKTIEQIGKDLFEKCICYSCSGNHRFHYGEEVFKNYLNIPDDLHTLLELKLNESSFKNKTGKHYEFRWGLLNFSILGRLVTKEQRKEYSLWDSETNERMLIAKEIRETFPNITATVAGETGIDIYETGKGKEQVVDLIDDRIIFFGDRLDHGGNDYDLAKKIEDNNRGICFNVNNWQETFDLLKFWG